MAFPLLYSSESRIYKHSFGTGRLKDKLDSSEVNQTIRTFGSTRIC